MDVHEAIHQRRSVGKVKTDPISRDIIEQLLEAAVVAPNHYRTGPWRFFVMTGNGRNKLGNAYAAVAEAHMRSEGLEIDEEKLHSEKNKAFRSPVIIAVACSPSDQPKVHRTEEFAAVHAAVQNMLLTAHALGLGTIWRSGDPLYHPEMKAAFELEAHEELVGLIYIGYPEAVPSRIPRKPYTDYTTWITE